MMGPMSTDTKIILLKFSAAVTSPHTGTILCLDVNARFLASSDLDQLSALQIHTTGSFCMLFVC